MKTSETLKTILKNNLDQYNTLANQSRDEVLRTLAPGAKAPETGKLHTATAKAQYAEQAEKARKQALDLIDAEIAKVGKNIAAAPSSEAINTLTALSLAKSKDIRDYESIYAEYGSNAQTARALTAIAKENGVSFRAETPEYDRLEALENCRNTFNSTLDPLSVPGAGSVAFIEMAIDSYGLD